MKSDSAASTPLSVVGTSNVLESMKQQFLQGTESTEKPILNGKASTLPERAADKKKKKTGRPKKSAVNVAGGGRGASPSSTSPKKLNPSDATPKGSSLRSCGTSKGNTSVNSSVSEASFTLSSTPTTPFTSDQPLSLGIKKNFYTPRSVTKGLREVRKMDNGTDGVTVKTEDDSTSSISPSASLTTNTSSVTAAAAGADIGNAAKSLSNEAKSMPEKSSLNSKSQSVDGKGGKTSCPLIKTAAKLMSPPSSRSKSADNSAKGRKALLQKATVKKISAKARSRPQSEPRVAVNGHSQIVQNGSAEEASPSTPADSGNVEVLSSSGKGSRPGNLESSPATPLNPDSIIKRPRGRPPKRKMLLKKDGASGGSYKKSGKKIATLIVDVHNTMNGEPQTVIPKSKPILRGKKRTKNLKTIEKSPDIKNSPLPPSKRQKNEPKLKVVNKKSKTSKKTVEVVTIKEEKDDTSASTSNQIQILPVQTQSTKPAKGVQKTTSREVTERQSSADIHSNKKKKVKKPVLKVKTLSTRHKEIERIMKSKFMKGTAGAVKKNNPQPKKNTIRKYLSTQKRKAVPKASSTNKKNNTAQVSKQQSKAIEIITCKEEQKDASNYMDVEPSPDTSAQKKNTVKAVTTETAIQTDVSVLRPSGEDVDVKPDPEAEVPEAENVDETCVEMKPCITGDVPQNDLETHTPAEVSVLEADKTCDKVSSLSKMSLQENDNINNNNTEDEGVICDKDLIVVTDSPVKKLTSNDKEMQYKEKEHVSKTSRGSSVSEACVGRTRDSERTSMKDDECQVMVPQAKDSQEKGCLIEEKHYQNEISCVEEVKIEDNVCDKSYNEPQPSGYEYYTQPSQETTLNSSESNNTSKESTSSSPSSYEGTTKETEVPFQGTDDQSLQDNTASTTASQGSNAEEVEYILGCDKDEEDHLKSEKKSESYTEEIIIESENIKTKEMDSNENTISVMQSEVNQAYGSKETDSVQRQTGQPQLTDQNNTGSILVAKKSMKQTKRRDGPVVRKKLKKGTVESPKVVHLDDERDSEKRSESEQITKSQEASQEASAVQRGDCDVLETLPSSLQKETDEVQEIIPEVQPTRFNSASEANTSSVAKTKDKLPRILKQLFQDEGVQNMLKSMNEDLAIAPETSPNMDSGIHKLRPKRITEPMLSSSPELDAMEALFTSSRKKKRGSEVDTLYIDEGVLNLLTSKEHPSRRMHQEDAASDVSQASSSKSFKTTKSTKAGELLSDSRKRKLSGASTASNTSSSSKSLQAPEPKRVRVEGHQEDPYELDMAEDFQESPAIAAYSTLDASVGIVKKKGIPLVPLSVKQKNKAIKMQLKLQKQKQMKHVLSDGPVDQNQVSSDVIPVPDSVSVTRTSSSEVTSLPALMQAREFTSKSVPPIKIKLASDSVTIKPVSRSSPTQKSPEITIIPKPSPTPSPTPSPVRPPLKSAQTVDLTGPPLSRAVPHLHPKTSPDKAKSLPDRQSPSSHVRRIEPLPGPSLPVPPPPPPAPPAPSSSGYPSLLRNCDPVAAAAAIAAASKSRQRVGGENLRQSQRASVRQSEANYHFRDISLRKFNNFTQIILSPSTTKMKNSLNSRVLRELCEALTILKRDESVKIVLLTGTGSTFCQGVDLTALQHANYETRKKNAENLVRGIKDYLKALVQFPKPIIAGVNGNAMGLGVTMLPLFDMVIANDKAEFCLPYAKLGQVPEGGATYTFPNLCGKLQSTQLFLGHKLTAHRAQEIGLVSESIWPATYQQELIPKVALLASQSAQSMEATKALMNHHLVTKLELSLESECRLLLQQWTSPHFALMCKRFLETQYIHLQKPVSLPL